MSNIDNRISSEAGNIDVTISRGTLVLMSLSWTWLCDAVSWIAILRKSSSNGEVIFPSDGDGLPRLLNGTQRRLSPVNGRAIQAPVVALLPDHKRNLAGHSELVEDVLSIIFRLVLADEAAGHRPFTGRSAICLVCRSWRHAALNSPCLWRFIRIDALRLRTADDLTECGNSVREFLHRSQGIVRCFRIINFPGPSCIFSGGNATWMSLISAVLALCDELYIEVCVSDESIAPQAYTAALGRLHGLLHGCYAPRLSTVSITVGKFTELPSIRYSIDRPMFNSRTTTTIRAFSISGIDLHRSGVSVCRHSSLTVLEFCTGSYAGDVAPILVTQRTTLQRLTLSHVHIEVDNLPLTEMTSLHTLALAGCSGMLLSRLRGTTFPRLANLSLDFDGVEMARDARDFFAQHPEAVISTLKLVRRRGPFSDYIPIIVGLPALRSLTLRGRIEDAFFSNLILAPWADDFALTLDALHIEYLGRLDKVATSLAQFLDAKAGFRTGCAFKVLTMTPAIGNTCYPPMHFLSTIETYIFVDDCRIFGVDCSDLLDDLSYWVDVEALQVLGGVAIVVLGALAHYILGVSYAGELLSYLLWVIFVNQNLVAARVSNRALGLAPRILHTVINIWQIIRDGGHTFISDATQRVALKYIGL